MNISLTNVCMSALLCGAITIATPAMAQLGGAVGTPGAGNAGVGAGRTGINGPITTLPATGTINRSATAAANNAGAGITRRTVNNAGDAAAMNSRAQANAAAGANVSPGVSTSGDVNSADVANNAASVNRSSQTTAGKMTRQANANAAEALTTRQLNQQQASINVNGSANTNAQQ